MFCQPDASNADHLVGNIYKYLYRTDFFFLSGYSADVSRVDGPSGNSRQNPGYYPSLPTRFSSVSYSNNDLPGLLSGCVCSHTQTETHVHFSSVSLMLN